MADEPITTEQKVTLSPEQQELFENLLNKRLARERASHERELSELRSKIPVEPPKTQANEQNPNPAVNSSKKVDPDLASLQATIASMKEAQDNLKRESEQFRKTAQDKAAEADRARQEALNIRKETAIFQAASKHNFYDVSDVVALTANAIKFDEDLGRFVVIGDGGAPKYNSVMDPMTLDEYYTQFAAQKKHLVRGDVRGGAGSSESQRSASGKASDYELKDIFGKDSDPRKAAQLKREDPALYAAKREKARAQGLIY